MQISYPRFEDFFVGELAGELTREDVEVAPLDADCLLWLGDGPDFRLVGGDMDRRALDLVLGLDEACDRADVNKMMPSL